MASKGKDDPLGKFVWLIEELMKSRNDKVKVFLVGHIPPESSEYNPNMFKHLHPHFD